MLRLFTPSARPAELNGIIPDSLLLILANSTPESPAFQGLLGPGKEDRYQAVFESIQSSGLQLTKRSLASRVKNALGLSAPELRELYRDVSARRQAQIEGKRQYDDLNGAKRLGHLDGILYAVKLLFLGRERAEEIARNKKLEKGNGTGEREIFDAQCDSDRPGKLYRTETKEPATHDKDADSEFEFAGAVRKVLLDVFGKNSLDGKGMKIKASVHYSNTGDKKRCAYDNAFWDGVMFVCGNASKKVFATFVLLSVVAHEMGHGFENNTLPSWNNSYYGEQGARMEAFADFVSFVVAIVSNEWTIEKAALKDVGGFQVGRGIFMPQIQGYCLRDSLNAGGEYNDPVIGKSHQVGHMKDLYNGESDRGGVHWNATIYDAFFAGWCVRNGGDIRKFARVWYNGHKRFNSNTTLQEGAELIASVCQASEKELLPSLREAANAVGLTISGNPIILMP